MTTAQHLPLDDADLQRRIAISKDFDMLQGLINVSTGVGMLVAWVTNQPWLIAVVAGAGVAIGSEYYKRHYGTWRAPMGRNAVAVLVGVIAVLAICVAMGVDHWSRGPILWGPLVSAVALGGGCWLGMRHVGLTPGHWIAVGLLAATSFLPMLGVDLGAWASMVPLAVALIAIGIIDHRRLVRGLGRGTVQ